MPKLVVAENKITGNFGLHRENTLKEYQKRHPERNGIYEEYPISEIDVDENIRNFLKVGMEFPNKEKFKEFYSTKIETLRKIADDLAYFIKR